MKPDQQRVSDIVMQTVVKLCASGLEGSRTQVQGVIGVTVDDNDVFVIHINDTVDNLFAASMTQSQTSVFQNMSRSPALSVATAAGAASVTPSSARKRARHRLVFQSPDITTHKRHEVVGQVVGFERPTGVVKQSCSEASYSSVEGSVSQLAPVNRMDYGNDLKPPAGTMTVTHDQTSAAAKSSVVVVDSDDEDVKPVNDDQNMPVMLSKHAECEDSMMNDAERENFIDAGSTADSAASTVSNLCISDVVGNVKGWSIKPDTDTSMPESAETSPTVLTDDPDWYPDDEDVKVMEEDEECDITELYAKATPPRQFQWPAHTSPWSGSRHIQPRQCPVSPHVLPAVSLSPRMPPAIGQVRPANGPVLMSPGVRRDDRAMPVPHTSPALQRVGVPPPQSPISYRTMYVCNIAGCNRGFAYKKNLVTHQRAKHN